MDTTETPAAPVEVTPEPSAPSMSSVAPKERMFTQAEVDSIVTERLNRERKKLEKGKLEEEGRYRELYESQEATIAELTRKVEGFDSLRTSVEKFTMALIEQLPPEITALLKKLDLSDQLDWLAEYGKNSELSSNGSAPKLTAPVINDIGGRGAKPVSRVTEEERQKELRSRFRIGRS